MPPKAKPKSKRTHVPALDKLQLEAALKRLKESGASKAAIEKVEATLKAASNPHAEDIDVVVSSLEPARQKLVKKTAKAVREVTQDVTARGRAALEEMSDEEWQRLLDSE